MKQADRKECRLVAALFAVGLLPGLATLPRCRLSCLLPVHLCRSFSLRRTTAVRPYVSAVYRMQAGEMNVVEGLSLPFLAQVANSGSFTLSEGRYRRSALVFHLIEGGLELRRYRILWSRRREVSQEPPAAIECSKRYLIGMSAPGLPKE